jgi:hypothetical protein
LGHPLWHRSADAPGKELTAWGGVCSSDIGSWMHGREVLAACFGVKWLPRAASVRTRFLGKFRRLHVERLRESSCGYVVNLWNRSGNTHTAHPVAGFLDQTCRELPRSLKVRRVLADRGFCDNDFLEPLESEGLGFIVAIRQCLWVSSGPSGLIQGESGGHNNPICIDPTETNPRSTQRSSRAIPFFMSHRVQWKETRLTRRVRPTFPHGFGYG